MEGLPADFWILLGPDYAGKSSIISAVIRNTGWHAVSYDDRFLTAEFAMIGRLRDEFLSEALHGLGKQYSPDFVLSILQAGVLFLRDQVLSHSGHGPVVVDSYYYKVLAKCRLSGLVNEVLFGWWHSFPVPRRVIFLDIDRGTAWRRATQSGRINRFEHYGDRPTRESFDRFQGDLRRQMFAEVGSVPMAVLESGVGMEEAARRVEDIVRSDHDDLYRLRVQDRAVPAKGP